MKNLILLMILASIASCKSNKLTYFDLPFNERELNIKCILKYLEHVRKDCKSTCDITVSTVLDYYDDCLLDRYDKKFDGVGTWIDKNKVINAGGRSYQIPQFGSVSFGRDVIDTWDYKFAPMLYNPESKEILGQVLLSNGERYFIGFIMLGSEIYYSFSLLYGETCQPGG